jgi:hypothetical protein
MKGYIYLWGNFEDNQAEPEIKNKDFTRRSFCDSNSGILFDRLEKEYDMAG